MSMMHEFDPNYPRPTDTPKFVPGPWGVAIGKRTSVVQLGVTGPAIAVCNYDNGPIERANVRLIAAAPELYEACSALLDQFEQRGCSTDQDHPDRVAVEKARAALAKAVQP